MFSSRFRGLITLIKLAGIQFFMDEQPKYLLCYHISIISRFQKRGEGEQGEGIPLLARLPFNYCVFYIPLRSLSKCDFMLNPVQI